jgi:hypothetical protein
MTRFQRLGNLSVALAVTMLLTFCITDSHAVAQSGKGKSKAKASASEVKQIDQRLQKLQDNFETESTAIIEGYEKAGHYERAKFLLEVLLKLDPYNENIKKRIAENKDLILNQSEFEQRFDPGNDWTPIGNVYKDQPVRITASGEYRVTISAVAIGPNGFPTENIATELVASVPTGALMGMVVTEDSIKEKKPPEPFAIKTKYDFTPKQNGQLYLKVNLPPGSRCNGDLKIKLSGILRTS